jgi:hypothetical protein
MVWPMGQATVPVDLKGGEGLGWALINHYLALKISKRISSLSREVLLAKAICRSDGFYHHPDASSY